MDFSIGTRYNILKKLGEGGMGEVYLAQDSRLERRVALKFLSQRFSDDPVFRNRFMTEARAAAAVDHPYICKIYEIEEVEGKTFLVLEYVEGPTMQSRMRPGRLPIEDALRYTCEIAEALAEAHQSGVIHRDVKPGNIMLTKGDHVKVMDFGLAKHIVSTHDESTQLANESSGSVVVGTPQYMSPEHAHGGVTDGRSDVFGLGIMLYEMVSGIHPFRKATPQATIAAIVHEQHPPLNQLVPPLPNGLTQIIDRMLAKSLAKRYGSMQELWRDLIQMQRGSAVQKPEPAPQFALAVLPFSDLSPQKDQEYFCDGIVEELINALTQVEGLRVVSRTTAFHFKGRVADIREIASELNVKAVVEGSVRKSGSRVRVTVNLVSAETGHPLWSKTYESELGEIFEVQDAIRRAVLKKLKTTYAPPKKRAAPSMPVKMKVYDEYLQGLYSWNKRTEDGIRKSVRHFENAIAADPNYLPALAGLANAYVTLNLYGVIEPSQAMPPAREATERALKLNPASAAALTARGCTRAIFEWDWKGAEQDFQSAIRADSKYALAHHWYANNLLIPLERFDEARSEIRAAGEIDPELPAIKISSGLASYFERRYLLASEDFKRAIQSDPGFGMAYYFLGYAYVQMKNFAEAIDALKLAVTLTGESPEVLSALGYAHALAGHSEDAQRYLDELQRRATTRYVSPVLPAQICIGLSKFNEGLDLLERACRNRSADLIWLNVRPVFDAIREDSRFQQICSDIGLNSIRGLHADY